MSWENYLQEVNLPFELPTPVYGAMLAIWQLRPALKKKFPLQNYQPKDYLNFLAWCTFYGRREYKILQEIPNWDAALNAPMYLTKKSKQDTADLLTVGMYLLAIAKCHYSQSDILLHIKYRNRFFLWFLKEGRFICNFPKLPCWLINKLKKDYFVENLCQQYNIQVTMVDCSEEKYLSPVYKPVLSVQEKIFFFSFPRKIRTYFYKIINKKFNKNKKIDHIISLIEKKRYTPPKCVKKLGVNLIGYAKGELGIGEDIRMVALACVEANIPFCIINVSLSHLISQYDESVVHWISEEPQHEINIFCMTGTETVRFLMEQGSFLFNNRYNIGLWPWELPKWPIIWEHAYNCIDEIWGISHYTTNAYKTFDNAIPMLLPVTVDNVYKLGRYDFNLPLDKFLFMFSFDLNSTLVRKNPKALISAFQTAFLNQNDVGLVLKVNHPNKKNRLWQQLKKIISQDKRIILFEGSLRRPEVLALYKSVDCLVSLHRAEGFGRAIAEAIILKKQVVATKFSGNLDFCSDKFVHLVNYKLTPVKAKDYFDGDGQLWAEPCIKHAANLMWEAKNNPKEVMGNELIEFSPQNIGIKYKTRLLEIVNS